MAKIFASLKQRPGIVRVGQLIALAAVITFVGIGLSSRPHSATAVTAVSGTVYAPDRVTGVAARVCINGPVGECVDSDAEGKYDFASRPLLPPGSYDGQATPIGLSPYGPSSRVQFDVIDGSPKVQDFYLTAKMMQGQFIKADGTGVRGSLDVYNGDYSINNHVESDDSGYYSLGGFPSGTYTAQPRVGWNVTGLIAPDPIQVTLDAGATITQNFTLLAATKTITGQVKRTNGVPVANACINANRMNGQGFAGINSDAAGNFTMSIASGSWNVQVNPCNPTDDWIYIGAPLMIDFALDTSVETKIANFTVAVTTSTISGVVTDQTGTLVTTGNLNFRTNDGMNVQGNLTTAGTYSARTLAGTYNVDFWSPSNSYSLPQMTVTVADGEAKILNIAVVAKTAHIKGTVKTPDGLPAVNVMVNAWEMTNTDGKPGAWGNGRSIADGSFDVLVTPGTYGVNIGTEPNSTYVWTTPTQIEIAVPLATSVITAAEYPVLNFIVAKADSTINGKLTAGGAPLSNNSLCVYARLAGTMNQNCGPVQPNGTYSIKVASSAGTAYEIGCFSPPNMPFSCPQAVAVTIVPGGSVVKDLDLMVNNSSIVGQLYDQSGFPLSTCESFRGSRVFADNPGGNGAHYEGEIGTDCKYRISLVAGVYSMNSFFTPDSGVMNSPPGAPVQVFSGQSVQKNLMVAKADAYITVKLLDKAGNGTRGYINVDNNEEINKAREGNVGQGDQGNKGADLGFNKKMPCGATDLNGTMKCCSDSKNKKTCQAFAIPDGPKGCKNAWDCVQICKKDKAVCAEAMKGNQTSGPQPGSGEFVAGPGGCKSDAECQKYCSVPANQDECAKFKPPSTVVGQSISKTKLFGIKPTRIISSIPVKASADAKNVVAGDNGPGFDKGIQSSGPTDQSGNAKILVLSGHKYKVCAGLPPESDQMPPKCQSADLTNVKSATITLQLRDADAKLTGTVKMPDGTAATRCFVHAWAEDGSFSGQSCLPNGSYKLNLTADTTWHFGADSMDGAKFFRSEESTLVVVRGTKAYTKTLALIEGKFEIPQPVTVSGACSSPLVISMSNGAKISIPSGGLSTSTDGSCSCTATPTIDLISTKSNQPQGAGYTIDCRDETNAQVTTLKSSATITVPYTLSSNEEGTSIEDALKPVLYQSDSQSYKTVDSYTLDKTNNLITFSVDHFSAYTVSNGSGTSSSNAALKTVTTAKKNDITSFTVNKKKVTPFPKCKESVQLVTKSVKGVQLIAVGSSCEGLIKVYNTSAKLVKSVSTGWRGVATLSFTDVTKDGAADIIGAPTMGQEVWVLNVASKYKVLKAKAANRASQLTANAIDFRGNGVYNLVVGTVTNGSAGDFQIYTTNKGALKTTTSPYSVYLKNSGGSVVLSIPKVAVSSLAAGKANAKTKIVKVAVKGKNFTPDTFALIGSVGTTVKYKSVSELEVSFDSSRLTPGKYKFSIINPGGQSLVTKQTVTVK